MKTNLCCLFCLLCFVSCGYADSIGHWRLDETSGNIANDSSFINNGTFEGTPLWQPTEGIGGAIQFDQALDRIKMPSIDVGSEFTVMAWVKPDDVNQAWARLLVSQYGNGFYLGTYAGSGEWMFIVNGNFGLHGGTAVSGEWQHVVGVYDGSASLFMNGQRVAGPIVMNPPSVPNQIVTVGLEAGNSTDKSILGFVDDVAIFNRALTQTEVLNIYNDGLAGKDINHWQSTNPNPQNLQTEVETEVTLSWDAGINPPQPITSHVLYLGTDAVDVYNSTVSDPNGNTTVTELAAATTTYTVSLNPDTNYYWRVDEVSSSSTLKGSIWSFQTVLSRPVIVSDPADTWYGVGETAIFTVEAVDPLASDLTYAWYEGISPDTSNPVGENSSTLEFTVTAGDVGKTYYCQVTNSVAETNSNEAELKEKVLLAYWPFDDADDPNSIVEGSPMTMIVGSPVEVDGADEGGKALSFDGNDGLYTEISKADYFDGMNDYCAISCWIKTPGGFSTLNPYVTRTDVWAIRRDGGPDANFYTEGTGDGSGPVSQTNVLNDEWNHIVGTYDGTTKKLYVNGKLEAEVVIAGEFAEEPNPVSIGCYHRLEEDGYTWITERMFSGAIDEVRLYNCPLSARQVADLYVEINPNLCIGDVMATDLNKDCEVNLEDFAILAGQWLECNRYPDCVSNPE